MKKDKHPHWPIARRVGQQKSEFAQQSSWAFWLPGHSCTFKSTYRRCPQCMHVNSLRTLRGKQAYFTNISNKKREKKAKGKGNKNGYLAKKKKLRRNKGERKNYRTNRLVEGFLYYHYIRNYKYIFYILTHVQHVYVNKVLYSVQQHWQYSFLHKETALFNTKWQDSKAVNKWIEIQPVEQGLDHFRYMCGC